MYEQHFGLNKRPFRVNATGTDVFVGPHIAVPMAGLKKALAATDAMVSVAGPAGSGKTTLVNRALETIGETRKLIFVARMRLSSDDVLEFLLDEIGVQDKPNGTFQRFALFRRQLKRLEEQNTRVFIAIEDAVRLGADTLAEIEALTAADAGESAGASVILLGDESLQDLLRERQLDRIAQRTRQRFSVAAFPMNELRGYLRHCFRLAGGDFEQVFEANAAELLQHLSKGIPRVANNLVESAMTAAADQDLAKVPSQLLARVAENEYGISAAGFDLSVRPVDEPRPTPTIAVAPELVVEDKPEAFVESVPEPEPDPEPAPISEEIPELEVVPVAEDAPEEAPLELPTDKPVLEFAEPYSPEPEKASIAVAKVDETLPELIQDTLPDLKVMAPEFATFEAEPELLVAADPIPVLQTEVEPEPEPSPEPEPLPEPEPEPELESKPELPVIESSGTDVPAWDRDPTMAELKPDLDALEQAMAFAQTDEPNPVPTNSPPPPPAVEEPERIPEITLDHAISQRIESNLIDEPGEVGAAAKESNSTDTTDLPAINIPKKTNKKADAELEKIAVELAKAKSLEDVDEKLAETLFGEELNLIAAQFMKKPPNTESANDDQKAAPAEQEQTQQQVVNGAESDLEVTLEAPRSLDGGGMDLSASQRLKTVRALNADLNPSAVETATVSPVQPPAPPAETPESIEDQITSMTQTLKALDVTPPVLDDDDDNKGGFFSRFKRS